MFTVDRFFYNAWFSHGLSLKKKKKEEIANTVNNNNPQAGERGGGGKDFARGLTELMTRERRMNH